MNYYTILTGGPGSGKSTLLEALAQTGLASMPEAGRAIIQHQVAIDGPALPWKNPSLFAELMLAWELRSYEEARTHAGPVLFDRGIPDVAGYLRLEGLPIPPHLEQAISQFRYHARVFILPPWEGIYTQDSERKQSFAVAEQTYHSLVTTYRQYGYELLELPRATVAERMQFVRSHLGLEPRP